MPTRHAAYLALAGVLGLLAGGVGVQVMLAGAPPPAGSGAKDNEEVARLFREDQSDRAPALAGKEIDWSVVGPRDQAREARVKELYRADALQTGADYFHAAMVLQHAQAADDQLLAHEFCIVAASRGEPRALWLAAASEDRFLMNIGRPQRFATQYRAEDMKSPLRLYKVDPAVTDGLRQAFHAPSLAEATAREKAMNEKVGRKSQAGDAK